MAAEVKKEIGLEIAHVLFIDIVVFEDGDRRFLLRLGLRP